MFEIFVSGVEEQQKRSTNFFRDKLSEAVVILFNFVNLFQVNFGMSNAFASLGRRKKFSVDVVGFIMKL